MLPVNGLYSKQHQNQINQTGMKPKIIILFKARKSGCESNMETGSLSFVYPSANVCLGAIRVNCQTLQCSQRFSHKMYNRLPRWQMLICKSKTWKFPLGARWWLNVNCLTFMFILLKVPLYVQTKLSMWLEEHISKWTEKSNHQYKAPPAYMDHGKAKHVIRWELLFLCLQNCEENIITEIKSLKCLPGKNLKPLAFSLKWKMLTVVHKL